MVQATVNKKAEPLSYEDAMVSIEQALHNDPNLVAAWVDKAKLLQLAGKYNESLGALDAALAVDPKNYHAMTVRSGTLCVLKRLTEGLAAAGEAIRINPNAKEAHLNRGAALMGLNRCEDAIIAYEYALKIKPDWDLPLQNYGAALHAVGKHEEAMRIYRRLSLRNPKDTTTHSTMIVIMDYIESGGFRSHCRERRKYAEQFKPTSGPVPETLTPWKLRIGYVSSDFRNHSAASCFMPVIVRHNREQFEVYLYHNYRTMDEWSLAFKNHADKWTDISRIHDNTDVYNTILGDKIDILVDLSGHTAGNRLPVFALKPAPIQVSAWGHAGGTGLPQVDYLFSDPVFIPEDVRKNFAEKLIDLPCVITFQPPDGTPEIEPSPFEKNGYITFGCFNRYSKIMPEVEKLWSRILKAVPESRLMIKAGAFDDEKFKAKVAETWKKLGIEPERLILLGQSSRGDHMKATSQTDIVLDPFPLSGGITTLEALWMGVPVVTKLGCSFTGRTTAAIMSAVGMADWVGINSEEYLRIAVKKASDTESLALFRKNSRSILLGSEAFNPEKYTQIVENRYRDMWSEYVRQH